MLVVLCTSAGGAESMSAKRKMRFVIVDSSGWLTTIENMKGPHCPCWNFTGLETHFEFADILACVAPRTLICENGEKEPAGGGFPLATGESSVLRERYASGGLLPRRIPFPHDYASAQRAIRCIVVRAELNSLRDGEEGVP